MDITPDASEVRRATLTILATEGYRQITFARVSREASCNEAELAANWPTVTELVFSALVDAEPLPPPPDMGSLEGDVLLMMEPLVQRMGNRHAVVALPHLLADLDDDPVLHQRFLNMFTQRHLPAIAVILDRARTRGEIDLRPSIEEAHVLLTGPLLSWVTLYRKPMDDEFVARFSRALAAALVALADE